MDSTLNPGVVQGADSITEGGDRELAIIHGELRLGQGEAEKVPPPGRAPADLGNDTLGGCTRTAGRTLEGFVIIE